MLYQTGDKIITKKQHACGGSEWVVLRTGADIKLKCSQCGRVVFLSVDQVKKMAKTHVVNSQGENNG